MFNFQAPHHRPLCVAVSSRMPCMVGVLSLRKEKQRRYSSLTLAEKVTLFTSRFFLSNKYARNFIFFYVLMLHMLVFSTLFHFVHTNHAKCHS